MNQHLIKSISWKLSVELDCWSKAAGKSQIPVQFIQELDIFSWNLAGMVRGPAWLRMGSNFGHLSWSPDHLRFDRTTIQFPIYINCFLTLNALILKFCHILFSNFPLQDFHSDFRDGRLNYIFICKFFGVHILINKTKRLLTLCNNRWKVNTDSSIKNNTSKNWL